MPKTTVTKSRWITLSMFVGIAAFHLWSLMRGPAPFVDEAWIASRAWTLIQTGEVFGPLDRGVLDRFEGHRIVPPWAPTLVQSLGLRLAGEPSLPAARLVSLAFGMVLLMAVYAIAARLVGVGAGRLSVLLTSLSWPFLYSAHLARPDVYSAALGLTAIALHLGCRPPRMAWGALSGLSLGVGFVMHPNAAIYAPAVAALFFLEHRWSMFRRPPFWAFAAGASVGPIFHAVRHVLPHPEIYSVLGQLGLGEGYAPPVATLDPRQLARAFSATGGRLVLFYQALLPLVVGALGVMVVRRSETDKSLLVLAAVPVLSFTLLIKSRALYYGIYFTPTIDVAVAALIAGFFRQPWRGSLRDYVGRVFVGSACLGYAAINLLPLQHSQWEAYRRVQDRIVSVIHPGESIMSVQTYWLGLYDHPYYSWEQLIYYQRYALGSTLEVAFREFRPDVFIVDKHLDFFISDPPDGSPPPYLWLPRSRLEAFLDRQAALIGEFDDEAYGPVWVYRIDWQGDPDP